MSLSDELTSALDAALNLNGRNLDLCPSSPLMGSVPELDSMGVVALINTMEERWGIVIEDDEIDGAVFATFGSLLEFVQGKIAA